MKYDLTHARHDPAHCLAPGLFRSLKRGERKVEKLDVQYWYGDKTLVHFTGFEPLDGADLRVLQGLIAMAAPEGACIPPQPRTELGMNLRTLLEITDNWNTERCPTNFIIRGVRTTIRHLLTEIGMTGSGDNIKSVHASLKRMANVTVFVQDGGRIVTYRLLSFAADKATGEIAVALNPRVTAAMLGAVRHTHIDMNEVRALQSDPARLVHQRLCAWIDPGKSGKADLDTLCTYAWPQECNDEAMKKRRQVGRRILDELRRLGWEVCEYYRNRYEIRRPAIRKPAIDVSA